MRNINIVLNKHNLRYQDLFNDTSFKLKSNITSENWRLCVVKELIFYRDFNEFEFLSIDEINFILNDLCTN